MILNADTDSDFECCKLRRCRLFDFSAASLAILSTRTVCGCSSKLRRPPPFPGVAAADPRRLIAATAMGARWLLLIPQCSGQGAAAKMGSALAAVLCD